MLRHLLWPFLACLVLCAGCAHAEVTLIGGKRYAAKPPDCQVQIHPATTPEVEWEDIASVRVTCGNSTACIQKLQQTACRVGGDIVYGFVEGMKGSGTLIAATIARAREVPSQPIAPRPQKRVDPPSGAVGFVFDDTTEDAASICTSTGHNWAQLQDDIFTCDGLPERANFGGEVLIKFCDKRVCVIQIAARPADSGDNEWLPLYRRVEQALLSKYGRPETQQTSLPIACMGDKFLACIESGDSKMSSRWQWGPGKYLSLRMIGPKDDKAPAVRITYGSQPQASDVL